MLEKDASKRGSVGKCLEHEFFQRGSPSLVQIEMGDLEMPANVIPGKSMDDCLGRFDDEFTEIPVLDLKENKRVDGQSGVRAISMEEDMVFKTFDWKNVELHHLYCYKKQGSIGSYAAD